MAGPGGGDGGGGEMVETAGGGDALQLTTTSLRHASRGMHACGHHVSCTHAVIIMSEAAAHVHATGHEKTRLSISAWFTTPKLQPPLHA